jgi:hypothetical protein
MTLSWPIVLGGAMSGHESRQALIYCDMCHGILRVEADDRDDFIKGQLIMAALCLPVALIYLLFL